MRENSVHKVSFKKKKKSFMLKILYHLKNIIVKIFQFTHKTSKFYFAMKNLLFVVLLTIFIVIESLRKHFTSYDKEFKPVKSLVIDSDFVKKHVINPHNFEFILNPKNSVCNDPMTNILAFVHSTPKRLKNRQFIRETWSNRVLFPNLRTVFMMGSSNDSIINSLLQFEFDQYGDIVQENFLDTYRNLTYKAIMALKWIKEYCTNVDYIVKLDEDILMNTFALFDYLREIDAYKFSRQKAILCHRIMNSRMDRDSSQKWFVTYNEIRGDVYRDYCAGAAYIFTPDLPAVYYNLSFYVPFFWLDDYYVTGRLRNHTNTRLLGIESKYIFSEKETDKFFNNGNKIIFGHFTKKNDKLYKIWKKILLINQVKEIK